MSPPRSEAEILVTPKTDSAGEVWVVAGTAPFQPPEAFGRGSFVDGTLPRTAH